MEIIFEGKSCNIFILINCKKYTRICKCVCLNGLLTPYGDDNHVRLQEILYNPLVHISPDTQLVSCKLRLTCELVHRITKGVYFAYLVNPNDELSLNIYPSDIQSQILYNSTIPLYKYVYAYLEILHYLRLGKEYGWANREYSF